MSVQELIDVLKTLPIDYEVMIFDAYSEMSVEATQVDIDPLSRTVEINNLITTR